jgi:hypothetical protein
MGSNPGGMPLMTDEAIREIYKKLSHVESSVGDVRSNIGNLKVMLEHMNGDFDRLEEMLESLERIMYGKGATTPVGMLTRIVHLERLEERRQAMIRWLWIAIGGLIIEGAIRLIQVLPPH